MALGVVVRCVVQFVFVEEVLRPDLLLEPVVLERLLHLGERADAGARLPALDRRAWVCCALLCSVQGGALDRANFTGLVLGCIETKFCK